MQQQLKAALKLHLLPRGEAIVPMSPLDKIVTILDTLLEASLPPHKPLCSRNAVMMIG